MPKLLENTLKNILKKIKPKPSEEKKLSSLAQRTLSIAREVSKKYQAKAIIAGSLTRSTWLPGKKEFDIFIIFPENLPENKLEEYGLLVGKEIVKQLKGKSSVDYAQHPYTSGLVNGIDIDIVPCYGVASAEKIKSAVDRTPFHVSYIEKNLPLRSSDEVRLLKQFLTANKLYGADAKTQGFSGYVCELLIINYSNFVSVLKESKKWVPSQIIDIKNYYREDEYAQLRKKFKNESLILIDPTDKNRNTSSALSSENFMKFKKLAKEFLDKPNPNYFLGRTFKPITTSVFNKIQSSRKTELILIKFNLPKVVPDILWPQLRRFGERLRDILEETKYEFKVLRYDVYSNEKDTAVVLLEMEVSRLPPIQKRVGPYVFDYRDSAGFLEKYKKPLIGPFIEDNKWTVEIKRKFITADQKLLDTLKKNSEILKAKGIPNYIADQIAKKFELISDSKKISRIMKKDKNFGVFLKNYYDKENLI